MPKIEDPKPSAYKAQVAERVQLLKRLVWPSAATPSDVETLGQQGFWVCAAVAVISAAMLAVTGDWKIGALVGLTYFLAGTGVRQGSVIAAVTIFLCYLMDRVMALALMTDASSIGNPLLAIVVLVLLAANVRATLAARGAHRPGIPPAAPSMAEGAPTAWWKRVADAISAAVWPKGQYVFYVTGGVLLVLTAMALAQVLMSPHAAPGR